MDGWKLPRGSNQIAQPLVKVCAVMSTCPFGFFLHSSVLCYEVGNRIWQQAKVDVTQFKVVSDWTSLEVAKFVKLKKA